MTSFGKYRFPTLAVGVVAGLVAGALGGTVVLFSNTPAEIQACYAKSTGALRVVVSTGACKSGEVAISWGQQGEQGPVGPTGPQGPAGPEGPGAPVAEPWHEVGAPGEPAFQANWVSEPQSVGPICSAWSPGCPEYGTVAFYKDSDDVVHLRGVAKMPEPMDSIIFQLPAGYRPASASTFPVVNSLHPDMTVTVYGEGWVQIGTYPGFAGFPPGAQRFWLDGISFRLN